jgi:hypothetical protein
MAKTSLERYFYEYIILDFIKFATFNSMQTRCFLISGRKAAPFPLLAGINIPQPA